MHCQPHTGVKLALWYQNFYNFLSIAELQKYYWTSKVTLQQAWQWLHDYPSMVYFLSLVDSMNQRNVLIQERMMTSSFLQREEEERVTAKKFETGTESPACTKNRTHLPQVRSSTIYDLTTQCYPCSQQDLNTQLTWQVLATQERLSAFPDAEVLLSI